MSNPEASMANGMIADDALCACGQSFEWHVVNQPRHPFAGEGDSKAFLGNRRARDPRQTPETAPRANQGPATTVVAARWPFDPVLRQALIDKGVLTPGDLRMAEEKIHAVSALWTSGGAPPWYQAPEAGRDSSTPTDTMSTEPSAERENPRP